MGDGPVAADWRSVALEGRERERQLVAMLDQLVEHVEPHCRYWSCCRPLLSSARDLIGHTL